MAGGPEPTEGGISEVPNPTPEMAAKSKTPLDVLKRGNETYILQCGQCHHYIARFCYAIFRYTAPDGKPQQDVER